MSHGRRKQIETRISNLVREAKHPSVSDELRSSIANHIAVLASGYLEIACQEILTEFSKAGARPEISNFVESTIVRFQNPKFQKILDLTTRFSPDKGEKLQTFGTGAIADSVDSIVAIRHQVAHGQHNGTSLGTMVNYFTQARRLVQKLQDLFPRST